MGDSSQQEIQNERVDRFADWAADVAGILRAPPRTVEEIYRRITGTDEPDAHSEEAKLAA